MTLPVAAVNVAPEPEKTVPVEVRLRMLDPQLSVPAESATAPLNVCARAVPRLKVPPVPLMVRPPPLTGPVKVTIPAVFVIETGPVVVNPDILCVDALPANVTPPVPLVKTPVPLIVKLPPSVNRLVPVKSVAPVLIVKGIPALNIFGAPMVIAPILAIKTPPVPVNGVTHSPPVGDKAAVRLY